MAFRIIAEAGGRKELSALLESRKRHVSVDMLGFQNHDIVFGAILRIPRHMAGSQLPAKAGAEDEIAHRLVLHHLRRRHQDIQDDAVFAPIDDIVGLVAQMRSMAYYVSAFVTFRISLVVVTSAICGVVT